MDRLTRIKVRNGLIPLLQGHTPAEQMEVVLSLMSNSQRTAAAEYVKGLAEPKTYDVDAQISKALKIAMTRANGHLAIGHTRQALKTLKKGIATAETWDDGTHPAL